MKPTPFMGERHDLVNVEPGNPGAGNLLTWDVPANAVIQVISLKVTLTTNAVVTDRLVKVYVSDGGVVIPSTPAAIVQPASQTWTYFFTIGIAPLDLSADFSEVYQPFGCCYQIETGASLIVNVLHIQGTDQLAACAIRYFLWERG